VGGWVGVLAVFIQSKKKKRKKEKKKKEKKQTPATFGRYAHMLLILRAYLELHCCVVRPSRFRFLLQLSAFLRLNQRI
jgi:hypothetical protein